MVSFESIKKQLNDAKLYTMSGAVMGFMAFPLIDTLDGNAMTLKSAGLGALVGAAVGTGAGILINAARDNRIENYVVVSPLLGTGATMAALKAYPRTRSMSNKRLISAGLVGGTVGLTLGGSLDYLT
tara:strand:+ start:884 stop:1264 length:381 start_codon:yes stop_codon:yes gene_type:complete